MEEQNHIDKALAFMESLERLHNQLKSSRRATEIATGSSARPEERGQD